MGGKNSLVSEENRIKRASIEQPSTICSVWGVMMGLLELVTPKYSKLRVCHFVRLPEPPTMQNPNSSCVNAKCRFDQCGCTQLLAGSSGTVGVTCSLLGHERKCGWKALTTAPALGFYSVPKKISACTSPVSMGEFAANISEPWLPPSHSIQMIPNV